MAERIERLEEDGKIFVLRPEMNTVGRLESDYAKLEAFYQHGYDLMKEQYGALVEFLGHVRED